MAVGVAALFLSLPSSADAQAKAGDGSSLRASWTQFAASAVRGAPEEDLKYGGRIDVYATLDGSRLGLWNGLTINAHPEFIYGKNITDSGAAVLLPPNVAMAFPSSNKEDFDLSLYAVQTFGRASLTFGKGAVRQTLKVSTFGVTPLPEPNVEIDFLQAPSLPCGGDPLCGVAVLPVHAELAGCRGAAGPTRR